MKAPIEAMLTMLPEPCASIFRPNAWQGRYVPFRFKAMIRSNSSSGKSSAGERNAVPAELTSTSARPSSPTTRSASASTSALLVTSQRIATAVPPCSSIVATVCAAPASFTSTIATAAPACASPFAIAAPSPLPPPVTAATRPSSRKSVSTKPGGTSKTGSQCSSVEAIVRCDEPLGAALGHHRIVLPPEPAEPVLVDARLGHDRHPRLDRLVAPLRQPRQGLVVAEADAVARVVGELLEPGRCAGSARGRVDLVAGRARLRRREGGFLGGEDGGARLVLPVARLSRDHCSGVVGPVAVGGGAELEHDDVAGVDPPIPRAEVLPAARRLRPRPDGGVGADDARPLVPVATGDDRRADLGGDLRLRAARDRVLLEGVESETGDLVRHAQLLDVVLGLPRLDRLEHRRHVDERLRREGAADQGDRRRRYRVRLAVDLRGRRRLVAALVADLAAREPVLRRQLAEQARDLRRRQRTVEADRREGPDVTRPVSGHLVRLVLGKEQRRFALARHDDDAQPADLHPPTRGQHHVLRQPQEDGVEPELAHRLLDLLDPRHAVTRSSAALIPATTSSTCGSTARSSGAA